MRTIDIVFERERTGLPNGPRFVEIERDGKSIKLGEWIVRDAAYDVLRIPDPERPMTTDPQLMADSGLNFWAAKLLIESALKSPASNLLAELGSLGFEAQGIRITIEAAP